MMLTVFVAANSGSSWEWDTGLLVIAVFVIMAFVNMR